MNQMGIVGALQQQVAQLHGMVKIYIPAESVVPEPMSRFNSWTAPT